MKTTYQRIALLILAALMLGLAACSGPGASPSGSPASNAPSSAAPAEDSADYTYDLKIGTALSPTHGQMVGFWDPWTEAVTEKTGGSVTFTVYTAGELIESGQEYDGLQEGIIDIAAPISFTYDPTNFPASDFCMLPLQESSAVIGAEAWKRMLADESPVCDGVSFNEYMFGGKNLFVLPVNVAAEACFCTTGKEINSVGDLAGLQFRAASATHTMLLQNLGMESVSMTIYDAYDAMSRGAIDGSIHFIADWASYGLEDLYRYCIDGLAFGGHFCSVAAWNLETWNSYPQALRDIMVETAYEVIPGGAQMFMDWRETAIQDYTEEYGTKFVQFTDLDPAVQAKFNEAMTQTWQQWMEKYDAEGYPATEMARLWMECIEASGGSVPDGVHALFA